jgi:alkanesulfonate monooxygenase SsuD/methylene tetrahydromethanopterin reductase-like flavin-dependent oxidoreductase (luciferase family)
MVFRGIHFGSISQRGTMFTLRFDMRAPKSGAPTRDLYPAALDMAAWGEAQGCLMAIVSEHHGSPDGYLSAPFVLASGIAGRTTTLGIQVAALLVPLHDPIDLAEQMAVLDVMSGGRVSYVCAIGYRAEEYAMFGREMKTRGKRMDACLEAIKRAWTGEPFEYEGRPVKVTPTPLTPAGPNLFMGGGSTAAVRRAARLGMGMIGQGGPPELEQIYRDACKEFGTTPGFFINPAPDTATSVYVAEDVDAAWQEIGPYMLHDAATYGGWMDSGSDHASTASGSEARTVDQLRAENGNYRIFGVDEAVAHVKGGMPLMLQPLVGGLPPELAWRSLELVAEKVLPATRG